MVHAVCVAACSFVRTERIDRGLHSMFLCSILENWARLLNHADARAPHLPQANQFDVVFDLH